MRSSYNIGGDASSAALGQRHQMSHWRQMLAGYLGSEIEVRIKYLDDEETAITQWVEVRRWNGRNKVVTADGTEIKLANILEIKLPEVIE